MSDYERLKALISERPYLVADAVTGRVKLATQAQALREMIYSGEFPSAVIAHIGRSLERFVRLRGVGKDRTFGLRDIATIAGMDYQLTWYYVHNGVIRPSIQPPGGRGNGKENRAVFSWGDAFCAGIVGSLRRQGLGLDVLRKVQPLLFGEETKKQAEQPIGATAQPSD